MAFVPDRRSSRQPLLNAPPVVLWLIGLLLVCHGVRVALPAATSDALLLRFSLIPARFADAIAHGAGSGDWSSISVTPITYMFLHADFTHVGVNCLWLLVFGPVVARWLGTLRFLLFSLLCGIAAAVLHLAVYWGSPVAVIGASGAISGLMGAGMRILYGHMHQQPTGLAPVTSRPIVMFSLVWTAVNIVTGVLRIGVTGDVTLIAWIAHLGGYFAGLFAIQMFSPLFGPFRLAR